MGKTTQIELLQKYFQDKGKEVLATKEPGGGLASTDIIRKLLKDKSYNLDGVTNVLLFAANRVELWQKVIRPALDEGKVVISDRNWWSTLTFEHYGFCVPLNTIKEIHELCLPERYLKPDIGIIMTLDEQERAKRMKKRDNNSNTDAFESRDDDFQKRVRDGYGKIAELYKIPVIDAAPDEESIHKSLLSLIDR